MASDGKKRGLRQPFSSVSHLVGAALFVAGLVALVVLAKGRTGHLVGFAVYGACAIALYLASGIYHASHEGESVLQRIDHLAIYFMIAGTYTPICVVALPKPMGWWVLAGEWFLASVGVLANLLLKGGPHWLRVVLYLSMGWSAVGFLGPLRATLSSGGLAWLIAGGLLYTIGVVFYATERPRLWPGKFDAHDLWHVFVLAASFCHFVTMLFVARIP